jgi:recombinational DNA repair protein RecT
MFHYLEIVNDNAKLRDADKFSHFAAIVKAGTTGLSFSKEGQLYPILYGNVVKVQIGAHGKRELLRRMPNVKHIGEGQVILKGDTFKHDKLSGRLLEHVASEKQPVVTLDNIVAAYFRIIWKDNSYNDVVVYQDDIIKAKNQSKMQGDNSTWAKWAGQMAVKVAYNRGYKLYYSAPQVEVTEIKGFDADDEEMVDDVKTTDVQHSEVEEKKVEAEVVQEATIVSKPKGDLTDF